MTAKCGDHDGRTDDRCNLCVLSSFIISHFNCMHCNLSIFFCAVQTRQLDENYLAFSS
jgi:hypothetical protein